MSAMLEISRLRQPAFAQSYGESRGYLALRDTEDGGSLRPVGATARWEIRGQK